MLTKKIVYSSFFPFLLIFSPIYILYLVLPLSHYSPSFMFFFLYFNFLSVTLLSYFSSSPSYCTPFLLPSRSSFITFLHHHVPSPSSCMPSALVHIHSKLTGLFLKLPQTLPLHTVHSSSFLAPSVFVCVYVSV